MRACAEAGDTVRLKSRFPPTDKRDEERRQRYPSYSWSIADIRIKFTNCVGLLPSILNASPPGPAWFAGIPAGKVSRKNLLPSIVNPKPASQDFRDIS